MNTEFFTKKYKNINFETNTDIITAMGVFDFLSGSGIEPSENIIKSALFMMKETPPENQNDYMYIVTNAVLEHGDIKKTAYPSMEYTKVNPAFDISFWAKLVYRIYDDVLTGKKTVQDSLDYHSNHLSDENNERANFIKWFEFYQKNENKKYSKEEVSMKKNAYDFPLMGSGLYSPTSGATAPSSLIDKAKTEAEKKITDSAWKMKLDKALRTIDRLLRDADNHISVEEQDRLLDLYFDLNRTVRSIRFHATAADLAYKTAHKFKKLGFDEGADILTKFAQQAPPTTENIEPTEELSPIEEENRNDNMLTQDSVSNPDVNAPFPNGVDIGMAISKLEDVAGILSERKIIRTLAEFDIILDKLGVASMFPELSEAQSRLIDAYSYSLVRVSRMLGMLSSGKSINEIAAAQSNKAQNQVEKEINKTLETLPNSQVPGTPENKIQQEFSGQPQEGGVPPTPAAPPTPQPNAPKQ